MKCPRCENSVMKPDNIRDTAITYNSMSCSNCGGFWISNQELKEIEMASEASLIEIRRIPDHEAQMKPMQCPQCEGGITMEKIASFRDREVVMDVCPKCARIWLDGGEMDAIKEDSLAANFTQLMARLRKQYNPA